MRCDRCEKRKATVHLTEIDPKSKAKQELHLCEVCAYDQGIHQKQPAINELLAGLIVAASQIGELAELRCEHCGLGFLQFTQSGLLGCPHDYDAFASTLVPMLEKAQDGASRHVGRTPGAPLPGHIAADRGAEILNLRRQLSRAVRQEDYETAARLRDRIQEFQHSDV